MTDSFAKARAADELFNQRKFNKALPLYEEALKESTNPLIYMKLGECQFNTGKFVDAAKSLLYAEMGFVQANEAASEMMGTIHKL
jgi:tetratricopeptide (TPR) repeat protein